MVEKLPEKKMTCAVPYAVCNVHFRDYAKKSIMVTSGYDAIYQLWFHNQCELG
jgi:hypothetical protein